jgi:electron transfer flavoprotein-quinone oxidoreductase
MEILDVVVVGAGLAGLSAAYYAAKEGLQVLVLERGDQAGSKNLSGGRLYLGPLLGIADEFLDSAPMERKVKVERISAVGTDGSITVSLFHRDFDAPERQSKTVLRAKLDRYLAERVGEVGGFVVTQKRVDSLVREGKKVVGIVSDGEEIRAKVVVIAEGVLGLLAKELGFPSPPAPRDVAVAVKEVIELPRGEIESRFSLEGEDGAAHLFFGALTSGIPGGGFLYTNLESISLGIVLRMESLLASQRSPQELLEGFKSREEITPLISGGKIAEYGAHLIPEARKIPSGLLVGDGYIVAGDAAGLALNMGVTVRGMDMAIASGVFAAKAILQAHKKGDYSKEVLADYLRMLGNSFVFEDMQTFKHLDKLAREPRLYREYPELAVGFFRDIFSVSKGPKERFSRTFMRWMRRAPSFPRMMRDLLDLGRI